MGEAKRRLEMEPGRRERMTLIGQKGCRNCSHHRQDGQQLYCGLNPPAAYPIFGPPPGPMKPPTIAWVSTQPPVSPDMYCSHHAYLKAYDAFDQAAKGAETASA